jgi:hypothetical protein
MHVLKTHTIYSKHFRGSVVTLVVGPDKKEFTVHKDLLVFYSDYFRAAFNGSFVEATDRKIDLFDANQEAFEHFLTWLYTRKLASDDEQPLGLIALVDLWLLGDRFQVPMLQNCVMDKIIPQPNDDTVFELGLVEAAYENTTVGSPLRRVLLEILAYQTALGEAEGVLFRKRFTVEILVDLVKEVASARKDKVLWGELPKRDKCFFHVHGKDEQC